MHDDFIGKTVSYTAPATTRDRVRSVVEHDSIHEWACPCSMPECHAVVFAALARNLNSSTPAIAFGTNVTFRPQEPDGTLRLGVIVVDGVEDLQSLSILITQFWDVSTTQGALKADPWWIAQVIEADLTAQAPSIDLLYIGIIDMIDGRVELGKDTPVDLWAVPPAPERVKAQFEAAQIILTHRSEQATKNTLPTLEIRLSA